MLISEKLKSNEVCTSFEVFPPKNDMPFEPVKQAVCELSAYKPDYISVTYGAGGGTHSGRAAHSFGCAPYMRFFLKSGNRRHTRQP